MLSHHLAYKEYCANHHPEIDIEKCGTAYTFFKGVEDTDRINRQYIKEHYRNGKEVDTPF